MINYPNSKKELLKENIFGVSVEDNYRWMEEESSDDLKLWVDAQNHLTQSYLKDTQEKKIIKERLEILYNYPKYNSIRVIGQHIIYAYNDGLQNQDVYYIQSGLNSEKKMLLDPNTLSDDGRVAIFLNGHSKDNRYLSYLQSSAGSDWHTLKIIDLQTHKILEDEINWVKFTMVSWLNDGFYYSAYEAPKANKVLSEKNSNMKIYYHQLSHNQKDDTLVFSDAKNPLSYHSMFVSSDEKTLILSSREGTYGGEISIKPVHSKADFKLIFKGFDSQQHLIGSNGEELFFISDEKAENKKIVKVNSLTHEVSIVIKASSVNLEDAYLIKEHLILVYLEDVNSRVYVYSLEGKLISEVILPGIGMTSDFTGGKDLENIFFTFTSFVQPLSFYSFDLKTFKAKVFKSSKVPFDLSAYKTEQVFCKSKDGTKVPVFLTYKKDLVLNGKNPTLLLAYGGFSISLTPSFNPGNLYFMERGGIYAQANIRGGSEYGESWHKAGMFLNKQNVYDDFIAVAETLIEKKYTSKDYLAIEGRSNGGLLMGVILNQRPDLFVAALPTVGVMDMIRYHKFTIGWGWATEYGNPDEAIHFNNIIKYSPLHNIKAKDYPAIMVLTADHDDRVVPAHSFKYIATLQEKNTSDKPMLIRIDKNSGHGAGKSMTKKIDEDTDRFAFLFHHFNK